MHNQNKISLMAHLVAGYPTQNLALKVADALIEGGASYLEIQLPFSDPSADGPVIQTACAKRLELGYSTQEGVDFIKKIYEKHPETPIFLMSYASLVYTPGIENFVTMFKEVGVKGFIIPDLPFDNDEGMRSACEKEGLTFVPVAAPSMSVDRIEKLLSYDFEFIYAALRAGITGSKTTIEKETLQFLNYFSKSPSKILGGFGIQNAEQAFQLKDFVHSIVAGSVFVKKIIQEYEKNPQDAEDKIVDATREKAKELSHTH